METTGAGLREIVDTGVFCASLGEKQPVLATRHFAALEMKGDLATETLRVLDCSGGITVRRKINACTMK